MIIVVAIIALISSSIAVAAHHFWVKAQLDTAETSTRTMRQSVTAYSVYNPTDACPTVDMLIGAGVLDEDTSTKDPWGGPWRIVCEGGKVTVSSDGPDKVQGTDDDIQSPNR